MNDDTIDILVVEENDNDRDSIVEALQSAIENVHVGIVHDSTSALDFICARGEYKDRAGVEPPRLILLSLRMMN